MKRYIPVVCVSCLLHIVLVYGFWENAPHAVVAKLPPVEFSVLQPTKPAAVPIQPKQQQTAKKKFLKTTQPQVHTGDIATKSTTPTVAVPAPALNAVQGMAIPSTAATNTSSDNTTSAVSVPFGLVTELPRKLVECHANYPDEARKLGLEGQVKLDVEILSTGVVGDVQIIEGLGHGLNEAAIQALRDCKFSPALLDGKVVTTRITYVYHFVLED